MKKVIIYHQFKNFATPFYVSKYDAESLLKNYPQYYFQKQETTIVVLKKNEE